jgi:hypothetical protein
VYLLFAVLITVVLATAFPIIFSLPLCSSEMACEGVSTTETVRLRSSHFRCSWAALGHLTGLPAVQVQVILVILLALLPSGSIWVRYLVRKSSALHTIGYPPECVECGGAGAEEAITRPGSCCLRSFYFSNRSEIREKSTRTLPQFIVSNYLFFSFRDFFFISWTTGMYD